MEVQSPGVWVLMLLARTSCTIWAHDLTFMSWYIAKEAA